jgi:hypothetical protein
MDICCSLCILSYKPSQSWSSHQLVWLPAPDPALLGAKRHVGTRIERRIGGYHGHVVELFANFAGSVPCAPSHAGPFHVPNLIHFCG